MAAGSIKLTVQVGRFGSAQTNFPVVFNATLSSGTNAFSWVNFFAEMSDADRKKVKIWNSDKTIQYNAEIEPGYDFANDKCVYHVAVDADDGDIFYLDYDSTFAENTTYIGDTGESQAQAVWDSNFNFVLNMADATTSTTLDSTSNNINGTKKAANEPIEVDSPPGKGQDFDDTDDYITFPASTNGSSFTLEMFFTPGFSSAAGGSEPMLEWANTAANRIYWRYEGGTLGFYLDITGTIASGALIRFDPTFNADEKHYSAVSLISNSTFSAYWDGLPHAHTETVRGINAVSSVIRIGNSLTHATSFFNGVISHVRASNIIRSADWIKATNYSLIDDMFAMEDVGPAPTITNQPIITIQT